MQRGVAHFAVVEVVGNEINAIQVITVVDQGLLGHEHLSTQHSLGFGVARVASGDHALVGVPGHELPLKQLIQRHAQLTGRQARQLGLGRHLRAHQASEGRAGKEAIGRQRQGRLQGQLLAHGQGIIQRFTAGFFVGFLSHVHTSSDSPFILRQSPLKSHVFPMFS